MLQLTIKFNITTCVIGLLYSTSIQLFNYLLLVRNNCIICYSLAAFLFRLYTRFYGFMK